MLLKNELDSLANNFMATAPAEVRERLMECINHLISSGIEDKAIKVGDKAPDFSLPNANGRKVALYENLNQGPVLISFYRGGWCPFCNLELRAYQKMLPDIKACSATLIGISPEQPDYSLTTVEKNHLEFEVLSDLENKVATKYGLVFALDTSIRRLYAELGAELPKINADESWTLPIPATYLVDQDGIIIWANVNANYLERAEPAIVLSALKHHARTG